MTVFADSSALVSLYADEPGHERIRALDLLCVSALARVEVPAAVWRKHRRGDLDAADAQVLVEAFEADLAGEAAGGSVLVMVGLSQSVLDAAARLCAVHGLRACDAVQLATGRAVRAADPGCDTFACFDQALRRAAAAEGFALLP